MPLRVTHYQRKPHATGNFSIESIFADVRRDLSDEVTFQARTAPFYSRGLMRRLGIVADAARHRTGVVHVTGDIHFAVLGLQPKRTVLTIHDCVLLDGRSGLLHEALRRAWVQWPVDRSAVVTTVSEATRQTVLKLSGCPPEKVRVVYNAIARDFKPQPHRFNPKKPRLLQLGTAPNKNLPRLIEAIAGLRCQLVIIGKLNEDLRNRIEAHGIELEQHDRLPFSDLLQEYARADLVTFVSTYEGFGLPIVEANAVGRAVIAGNVSSMPEVAGDGALLVDPTDVRSIREGIVRIVEDANFRSDLLEKGALNARRFDPDAIASQYLGIYREVAEANPA